jgi:hypothetical protein
VISGAWRLAAETELRHVFIKPDETVDERRRAQLKRLHVRAVREGKITRLEENIGELYVDGQLLFSLKDGFVQGRPSVQQFQSDNNNVCAK